MLSLSPLKVVVLLCLLGFHNSQYIASETSPSLLVLNSFPPSLETTTSASFEIESPTTLSSVTSLTESINQTNQENIALNQKVIINDAQTTLQSSKDDHAKASQQETINDLVESDDLSSSVPTPRPPFPLNQSQLLNGMQQDVQSKPNIISVNAVNEEDTNKITITKLINSTSALTEINSATNTTTLPKSDLDFSQTSTTNNGQASLTNSLTTKNLSISASQTETEITSKLNEIQINQTTSPVMDQKQNQSIASSNNFAVHGNDSMKVSPSTVKTVLLSLPTVQFNSSSKSLSVDHLKLPETETKLTGTTNSPTTLLAQDLKKKEDDDKHQINTHSNATFVAAQNDNISEVKFDDTFDEKITDQAKSTSSLNESQSNHFPVQTSVLEHSSVIPSQPKNETETLVFHDTNNIPPVLITDNSTVTSFINSSLTTNNSQADNLTVPLTTLSPIPIHSDFATPSAITSNVNLDPLTPKMNSSVISSSDIVDLNTAQKPLATTPTMNTIEKPASKSIELQPIVSNNTKTVNETNKLIDKTNIANGNSALKNDHLGFNKSTININNSSSSSLELPTTTVVPLTIITPTTFPTHTLNHSKELESSKHVVSSLDSKDSSRKVPVLVFPINPPPSPMISNSAVRLNEIAEPDLALNRLFPLISESTTRLENEIDGSKRGLTKIPNLPPRVIVFPMPITVPPTRTQSEIPSQTTVLQLPESSQPIVPQTCLVILNGMRASGHCRSTCNETEIGVTLTLPKACRQASQFCLSGFQCCVQDSNPAPCSFDLFREPAGSCRNLISGSLRSNALPLQTFKPTTETLSTQSSALALHSSNVNESTLMNSSLTLKPINNTTTQLESLQKLNLNLPKLQTAELSRDTSNLKLVISNPKPIEVDPLIVNNKIPLIQIIPSRRRIPQPPPRIKTFRQPMFGNDISANVK